MTEREKIIEIILNAEITGIALKDVIGGETTAKKLADTLIENSIGDIAEWKEKYARLEKSDTSKENCTIEQHNEIHYLRDKLKQTQKESDEWKARAEKAECILSEYNRYSEVINNELDNAIEYVKGMLKQAKSEKEGKNDFVCKKCANN